MENLTQPPQLKLDSPNLATEWATWLEDWELYAVGSGLNDKHEATQRAVFLHCIGPEARLKFKGFSLSDEDRNKLSEVKKSFEAFCKPTNNEVIERYQFWQLTPSTTDSIDAFVSALRAKAKTCNFGDQLDLMIRDRIVYTCHDKRTKETLIRADKLDLDAAIKICRAAESARVGLRDLGSTQLPTAASVAAVSKTSTRNSRQGRAEQRNNIPPTGACGNCGGKHEPRKCLAYNKTCSYCNKLGHFAKFCRRRQRSSSRPATQPNDRQTFNSRNKDTATHSVDIDVETDMVNLQLDEFVTINAVNTHSSVYRDIFVNGSLMPCKIDTGAQVNAMSAYSFHRLRKKPAIRATNILIKPYGTSVPVKPCGIATVELKYKDRKRQADFIIVANRDPTLLGLDSCLQLELVSIDACEPATTTHRTTQQLIAEFDDVFRGIGCMPGEHNITIDPSVPPVIHASRRVPLKLQPKLRKLLDDLERQEIIIKRTEPTDWVNSLLLVEKKNGSLRACLDPQQLNKAIKREHFYIPTFDDIVGKLHGKKLYTVIDMRDAFWSIKLTEDSSKLCTFNTPFGRYSFRRLPFGISSAPELLQRMNMQLFGDIDNVHVIFDDIIIAAADETEHDIALQHLLERARRFNVRFNRDKLRLKVTTVKYLGHVLSAAGTSCDPDKVRAIIDMPTPTDRKSLLRFIGMVQFLARWLPNLADLKRPLCNLLREEVDWVWSEQHEAAVRKIKHAITTAPVLKFFDASKPTVIQCDSSSTGLGAVLLQDGLPCSYTSRALTDSETRYAQIEKELLAIVHAVEKFEHFIYGQKTTVHTDHRPLQTIFNKPISATTARLQRMLLRIARFSLEVVYKPGKSMHVADALSRAYLPFLPSKRDIEMNEDIEATIHTIVNELPASNNRIAEIKRQTSACPELSSLRQYLQEGFPVKSPTLVMSSYKSRATDITDADGLLLMDGKIIIPVAMRPSILALIHEGHQGMEKCKALARTTVWWPGISRMIETVVSSCAACCANRPQQPAETLKPHPVPSFPWEKIGVDIFCYNRKDYLLVVDYFSKFPLVLRIEDKAASTVCSSLRSLFAMFGVPVTLFADNMPFASQYMRKFAAEWDFEIVTSSPGFPQSNGQAERAIQTVKSLFKKSEQTSTDSAIALMNYTATPLTGSSKSPAELFYNRQIRTKIPVNVSKLVPGHATVNRQQLIDRQDKYKEVFDRNAKDLPPLKPGDVVRVRQLDSELTRGVVTSVHQSPRSYIVETERGSTLRRNRRHLISTKEPRPDTRPMDTEQLSPAVSPTDPTPVTQTVSANNRPSGILKQSVTSSGRSVKLPVRFRDYVTY